MNRAGSLIGRGDLSRDLFAERHAGHKMRRVHRLIGGRGLPRPGRHKGRPNTGEPSAGDQSITRGIGGISAPAILKFFLAAGPSPHHREPSSPLSPPTPSYPPPPPHH